MQTDTPKPAAFPGFGLPLNFDPWPANDQKIGPDPRGEGGRLFRTALDESLCESYRSARMPMITLRETAMLTFMNQITDKEDWVNKVTQASIIQKWREEVKEQNSDFTDNMVDYCLEELKYKANEYKKTGIIRVFHGDVVKSDSVISQDLQEVLKKAVAPLENVPENMKDWHPGSNNIVLDLVHPSLYPLIYGRSRIVAGETLDLRTGISMSGAGEIVPTPRKKEAGVIYTSYDRNEGPTRAFSCKFQWLPCEIDLSGECPRIASYINNLHPQKHPGLYKVLKRIIDKIIPMWNTTLTPLCNFDFDRRIVFSEIDYGDIYERNGPCEDDSDDYLDRLDEQWINANKPHFLVRPEPDEFSEPILFEDPVDLKNDYKHSGLQIIVKLANIHLTPERSEYQGGAWHVEGKMNEHICASAIYYYDNENITPSHLAFRQASDPSEAEEKACEQDDSIWLEEIYGMSNRSAAVQNVGSVETREGRVVTFPNILQHQVQPFKLEDPTRPGHRKILALFLVDPTIRVISAAHVPCQQKEWWAEPIMRNDGPFSKLPTELRSLVVESCEDFPISLEEAKVIRDELMEERKKYELASNNHFEAIEISLCEH